MVEVIGFESGGFNGAGNADKTLEINVQTCDVILWQLCQIDLR